MGAPISIRLDDDVRVELEAQASSKGVGLATLLRELATQAAREGRRARIRAESKQVAAYVAATPDAQRFYDDWGMPNGEVG